MQIAHNTGNLKIGLKVWDMFIMASSIKNVHISMKSDANAKKHVACMGNNDALQMTIIASDWNFD